MNVVEECLQSLLGKRINEYVNKKEKEKSKKRRGGLRCENCVEKVKI